MDDLDQTGPWVLAETRPETSGNHFQSFAEGNFNDMLDLALAIANVDIHHNLVLLRRLPDHSLDTENAQYLQTER